MVIIQLSVNSPFYVCMASSKQPSLQLCRADKCNLWRTALLGFLRSSSRVVIGSSVERPNWLTIARCWLVDWILWLNGVGNIDIITWGYLRVETAHDVYPWSDCSWKTACRIDVDCVEDSKFADEETPEINFKRIPDNWLIWSSYCTLRCLLFATVQEWMYKYTKWWYLKDTVENGN